VQVLKAQAIANHVKKLPLEVLSPKECPLCGGTMQEIEATVRVGYHKCANCGYGQPVFQAEQVQANLESTIASLGIGILFALGIAAIAYLVSQSSSR
jgi:tRNA(Ile2) C34 agmatinyltransferase TiaS